MENLYWASYEAMNPIWIMKKAELKNIYVLRFQNFMSMFQNLVENDPTLTDIEIFNHLTTILYCHDSSLLRLFLVW